MKRLTFLISIICILQACSSTNYYIVRHAEKETQAPNMSSDVTLSASGKERADALQRELVDKNIKHIYSTNTIRTKSTAEPLSQKIGVPIQVYDPRDTGVVTKIKSLPKGNVLIVGHSNTVDDIVNQFYPSAQLKDLPDSRYGDIFIIKQKRNKTTFDSSYFGGNTANAKRGNYYKVRKS